jgi:hypothetical protein
MRFLSFALGTMLLTLSLTASAASVRIANDRGGQIGAYINKFEKVRNSDETVIIDGDCLSACTLVLGLVPPERICVTPRARLGFHNAWKPGFIGIHVENAAGTQILWDMYPNRIRNWIVQKGGLSDRTLYLSGTELTGLYPQCR